MKTVLFSIAGLLVLSQVGRLANTQPEPYMGSERQDKTYELLCKYAHTNPSELYKYCQ